MAGPTTLNAESNCKAPLKSLEAFEIFLKEF
jgi:hypothetical protein